MIFNIGKRDFKKYIISQLSYINLAIIPFQSSRLLSRKQCFWSSINSLVTDFAALGYRFKFYMTISWLVPVMWWKWSFYWWTDWYFFLYNLKCFAGEWSFRIVIISNWHSTGFETLVPQKKKALFNLTHLYENLDEFFFFSFRKEIFSKIRCRYVARILSAIVEPFQPNAIKSPRNK